MLTAQLKTTCSGMHKARSKLTSLASTSVAECAGSIRQPTSYPTPAVSSPFCCRLGKLEASGKKKNQKDRKIQQIMSLESNDSLAANDTWWTVPVKFRSVFSPLEDQVIGITMVIIGRIAISSYCHMLCLVLCCDRIWR